MTTRAVPGDVNVPALSGLVGGQARVETASCLKINHFYQLLKCIFKAVTKYSVLWEI